MPYPLPRNTSGPPVQLAQAVSVVMAPTPSPGLDRAVPWQWNGLPRDI